jgi:hypothetical protein
MVAADHFDGDPARSCSLPPATALRTAVFFRLAGVKPVLRRVPTLDESWQTALHAF